MSTTMEVLLMLTGIIVFLVVLVKLIDCWVWLVDRNERRVIARDQEVYIREKSQKRPYARHVYCPHCRYGFWILREAEDTSCRSQYCRKPFSVKEKG